MGIASASCGAAPAACPGKKEMLMRGGVAGMGDGGDSVGGDGGH